MIKHILFVENDLGSLSVFENVCEQAGIQYTGVQDGLQVASVLDALVDVDIVILDLEMPWTNGFEVMKIIRQHSNFAGIPIVACTVYAGEIENARASGFDSFIQKPLDIGRFVDQLNSIVNGQFIWEVY